MKILKEAKIINETIEEIEEEGFLALLGKQITCFCAVYIYTGKLVGVNKTCIKLEDPKIVYETGSFSEKAWKDAQALPNDMYIQSSMIEAFGIVK
jgi:hypothetical protein